MKKLTKAIVHSLKNQGMTFSEIAKMYGVSRQYASALYSGYNKAYAKTDIYKMYKRHYKGHNKPYKKCDYCRQEATSILSTSFTV